MNKPPTALVGLSALPLGEALCGFFSSLLGAYTVAGGDDVVR